MNATVFIFFLLDPVYSFTTAVTSSHSQVTVADLRIYMLAESGASVGLSYLDALYAHRVRERESFVCACAEGATVGPSYVDA